MNEDLVCEATEIPPPAENDAEASASESASAGRGRGACVECAQEQTVAPSDVLSDDPDAHSDPRPAPPASSEAGDGIAQLRDELNRLRAEMIAREQRSARIRNEYEEFCTLYPDVPLSTLSDALWQQVEQGTPLAAAYALEERRRFCNESRAAADNLRNRTRSAGAIGNASDGELSPSEVRAMTPGDVKKNFAKIMRSMHKWR